MTAGRLVCGLAPWVLAVLCAVHGLRTAAGSEPIFQDASRFALNGALLLDLVRDGAIGAPVPYAHRYYARLPAITIPYHPPLYPLFEALIFAIFGVSNFTARLAIACTVALACVLLYRLVCNTHGSRAFALSVVLVFFAMPAAQWLSSEVMLEFPSLVLVLAALICLQKAICLRKTGVDNRLGPWLWFAMLGIAAVWTKQQAVFLAAVPFIWLALEGRWREFARKAVWISVSILTLGSAAFYAISRAANSESSAAWDQSTPRGIAPVADYIWVRLFRYSRGYVETGIVAAVLFALSVVFYILLRKRPGLFGKCDLYIAVILSSLGLLCFMPFVETRYLFYTLPAVSVLVCTLLQETGRRLFSARYAWTAPAAFAILNLGLYHRAPDRLAGPAEAARFVLGTKTRRVLYCGEENGSFIFDVRASEPDSRLAVIRGDKLPAIVHSPEELIAFLKKFGVERVVLENHPSGSTIPYCDRLSGNPPAQLAIERDVAIATTKDYLRGSIRIYRVPDPEANPADLLVLPSDTVRGGIAIDLHQTRVP